LWMSCWASSNKGSAQDFLITNSLLVRRVSEEWRVTNSRGDPHRREGGGCRSVWSAGFQSTTANQKMLETIAVMTVSPFSVFIFNEYKEHMTHTVLDFTCLVTAYVMVNLEMWKFSRIYCLTREREKGELNIFWVPLLCCCRSKHKPVSRHTRRYQKIDLRSQCIRKRSSRDP